MFPPPIKRLRTDENQQETNTAGAGATSMMDDFEMTDDELLFTATQVEQQTNYDYYQSQPASQNPSRASVQPPPIFSNQTVLRPVVSEANRTQTVNKELELDRKLLMKEGQILILEKNNRLLSEKNARLNREKCLLKTEQDEAASAREQRLKSQLETCKSQLTFNERERSELQTRYHTLEVRCHESQETSNRLLREVTRLRSDKPSTTSTEPQLQQQQPSSSTNSTSNQYRLLQTQLTHFSAYQLLRTRTIDSSSMAISSLQTILDRLRPPSITQHIWQTLVDLIFFHQQNSTLIKLKQQDLTIGIDLITMTAFYQMITNVLNSFLNQQNRLTTSNNDQPQILTHEQLISVLDASAHFLFNTVKSTESFNKQENSSTIKKAHDVELMDDGSSQRSITDSSQIPFPSPVDHHTAYYTAKGQCLTILKYFLSHSILNKYSFSLFHRILSLYTFHFKTRPLHESERRKNFCAFLISLLDQQEHINPYQYLTAIILSLLDASPEESNWLCAVTINDDRSIQRCLCSVIVTHLDALIYLENNPDLDEYIKFLHSIYRLQLFIYDNEHFHKMELDNGQCPGLCWLTLFISFGQCLSRFLFHHLKATIKEQIYYLSIKFIKLLILFSFQLQPTTCLPQQAKELQLYTNPSLWHLYELMLLYRQQQQQSDNESTGIINKQVLDDQLCVFGYINDVLATENENHADEMR